jgi:hypothetical protein
MSCIAHEYLHLQKIKIMGEVQKASRANWLYFFISLVACILFLVFQPAWFWVTLPFLFTFLVRSFDMM